MGCGVSKEAAQAPEASKKAGNKASDSPAAPNGPSDNPSAPQPGNSPVTKPNYIAEHAIAAVNGGDSSASGPVITENVSKVLSLAKKELSAELKAPSVLKACTENVGAVLLEFSALFPPLTPVAYALGALANLCARATELQEDCKCFWSMLCGVETVLIEVFEPKAAQFGALGSEAAKQGRIACPEDRALIARLQRALDAAASYLQYLGPQRDKVVEENNQTLTDRLVSKALRLGSLLRSMLTENEFRKTLADSKEEIEQVMKLLMLKSSLKAERQSSLASLFAEGKFEQEAALRSKVEELGGLKQCLDGEGRVQDEVLNQLQESGALGSAILAQQVNSVKSDMKQFGDRMQQTEEKIDKLLDLLCQNDRQPHSAASWHSGARVPVNGFERFGDRERPNFLDHYGESYSPQSLLTMRMANQIDILQHQNRLMENALHRLQWSLSQSLRAMPMGNMEADRQMTVHYFGVETWHQDEAIRCAFRDSQQAMIEHLADGTHLWEVSTHIYGLQGEARYQTLCFRRLLGLDFNVGWSEEELSEGNKGCQQLEEAKQAFPVVWSAHSVADESLNSQNQFPAPDAARGAAKVQNEQRKAEISKAWCNSWWKIDGDQMNFKFRMIKQAEPCQFSMTCNAPLILGDYMQDYHHLFPCSQPPALLQVLPEVARYHPESVWNKDPEFQDEFWKDVGGFACRVYFDCCMQLFQQPQRPQIKCMTVPLWLPSWVDVQMGNPRPRLVIGASMCVLMFEKDPEVVLHIKKIVQEMVMDPWSEAIQKRTLGRVVVRPSDLLNHQLGAPGTDSVTGTGHLRHSFESHALMQSEGLSFNASLGMYGKIDDSFLNIVGGTKTFVP